MLKFMGLQCYIVFEIFNLIFIRKFVYIMTLEAVNPPPFPLYQESIYPSTLTSWPRLADPCLYAEITICSTFYTRDTFARLPGTCYCENNNYLSHWELFLLLEGQCTLKLIFPPNLQDSGSNGCISKYTETHRTHHSL